MLIAQRRQKLEITQIELARRLGVRQSTIAMWESNANSPRTEMLPHIASALCCRIDDLFEEMDQPQGGDQHAATSAMVASPPLAVAPAAAGGQADTGAPAVQQSAELPFAVGRDDDLPEGWKD